MRGWERSLAHPAARCWRRARADGQRDEDGSHDQGVALVVVLVLVLARCDVGALVRAAGGPVGDRGAGDGARGALGASAGGASSAGFPRADRSLTAGFRRPWSTLRFFCSPRAAGDEPVLEPEPTADSSDVEPDSGAGVVAAPLRGLGPWLFLARLREQRLDLRIEEPGRRLYVRGQAAPPRGTGPRHPRCF